MDMTTELNDLMVELRCSNEVAAEELIRRFTPMLHAVSRRAGAPEHLVADVVQTTWLRLLETSDRLREPERLPGWLRTVATREAWNSSQHSRREMAMSDEALSAKPSTYRSPEDQVVASDEVAWLQAAIAMLPTRQRQVMQALSQDPMPSYEEISEQFGIPIGSIGPTRMRAVEQLRRLRGDAPQRQSGKTDRTVPPMALAARQLSVA